MNREGWGRGTYSLAIINFHSCYSVHKAIGSHSSGQEGRA